MRLILLSLLLCCSTAYAQRELLTATRTIHVPKDAATVQQAVELIYKTLDLGNYGALINIACGTYTQGATVWAPWVGGNPLNGPSGSGSSVTIRGNDCVTVSVTNASCVRASYGGNVNVEGIRCVINNSGTALYASAFGLITITGHMDFGPAAGCHINANQNGKIIIQAGYSITGSAYCHYGALGGASIESSVTVTVANGLSMSRAFAEVSTGATVQAANTYTNYNVSGNNYDISLNGVLDTMKMGIPGTLWGPITTGGQYR